jgi:triphosphoribosyl-dephospho-CoA synthase
MRTPRSPGLCAQLACIWEASARKPGNVHRFRDFADASYLDYLASAAAIAPVLGPLSAVPADQPLTAVRQLVEAAGVDDSRRVFEAIRLANPAGLGVVPDQDVRGEPTRPLREVMQLAADRDLIARQYANGFAEVLSEGVPALVRGLESAGSLENAIIYCHLHLLAHYPDSLIARKCGGEVAAEASRRARRVLDSHWPRHAAGVIPLAELDQWLCAAGHARNPGTTADLVAASLFALLRQGMLELPLKFPWSSHRGG